VAEEKGNAWFCYMVRCRDGSFYAGITNDLRRRVDEHNRGEAASYTAKRRPVKLIWAEGFDSQRAARRREVEVKGWSRRKKVDLLRRNPSAPPSASAQGKGA